MPEPLLRLALLVAGSGAILILVGYGGGAVALVGIGVVALGTVLSAPAARGGAGWWTGLAAGTAIAGAGEALALLSDGVGGLLAALGAVTVLVAVALAFPPAVGGR